MIKLIICALLGHKPWLWVEKGSMMYFEQNASLGGEAYFFDMCERCHLVYGRKSL